MYGNPEHPEPDPDTGQPCPHERRLQRLPGGDAHGGKAPATPQPAASPFARPLPGHNALAPAPPPPRRARLSPAALLPQASGKFTVGELEGSICCVDFLAKALWASSLMHNNAVALEERRHRLLELLDLQSRDNLISDLRDAVESKDRILSSTSHELRTPLNGIIGLSDSLLQTGSPGLAPNQRQVIQAIKTSGARLLSLVNDLLDAASLKEKQLHLQRCPVDVGSVVRDVVELLHVLVPAKVALVVAVPKDLPAAAADAGRLSQIMHNLLGNAIKFTKKGSITISAEHSPGSDFLTVSVQDTGVGIPADALDRVFLPFEQARRGGGGGVGAPRARCGLEQKAGPGARRESVPARRGRAVSEPPCRSPASRRPAAWPASLAARAWGSRLFRHARPEPGPKTPATRALWSGEGSPIPPSLCPPPPWA